MSLIRKLFSQRAQLPKSDDSDWQAKSDLSFFELEQRTVFDGAMAATADSAVEVAVNEGAAGADLASDQENLQSNSTNTDGLVEALGLLPDLGTQTTEVVFVDTSVENYQQIVDGILSQQDTSRVFEVILLESDSDGIQQISGTLSAYSQLDAVHIISHGSGASVSLGNATLDANSIDEYAENISGWAASFTEAGDLLIYGCDLASIGAGEDLVNVLAELTGADVSASDDLTGHESLGGDWDLEYATGDIEVDVAVSQQTQSDWVGVLATETVSDDFSTNDFTGNTGSQNWTGNWSEVDGGAAGPVWGAVQVNGGELSFNNMVGYGGELSLTREVDLSGATSATLTFDYRTTVGVDFDDIVVLEVSSDGGASWYEQQTFANITGVSAGSGNYDISAHIASNTQIRFRIEALYGAVDEFFYVDNVQVVYEAGLPNNSISGTIFEDVDGDGDILDDGVGVENVEVSLYQDDGDGVIDAGDTYIGMELTDASGNFTFDAQANGTYWAVVDSQSISPSNGLNAQFSVGDSWADQSYGSIDAVTFDGSFNYQASDGALFGGMTADVSDDASNLTSAQHVNRVVLLGSAATGIDYGFSYNVITNTGDTVPVDPFTNVNAWESFDPGSNGVGTDPVLGYGGSVYDGRYIYHVPSGGNSNSHGEVLRYDTHAEYDVANSWTAFDPSSNGVGTDAEGYDGAVFDGRYIYFTPIHNGGALHGEVLRFDTQGDFETAGSWSTFDPGANGVGIDPDGYREARFDGRYVYFSPHDNGTNFHSEVLRFDTLGTFDNVASWTTFDPVTAGVASQPGYDGIEFDGRYMYFVPLYDGTNYHGEVVRYDTQATFNLASSWEAFDPGANGVGVDPDGYNGAVFDGQYVYFVPFRADLSPASTWTGEVMRYDTTATFGSAAAWETFDPGAAGVGISAEGFVEAVFDDHYIYFLPNQQDGGGPNGEVLRYDIQGTFNSTSSWTAFNPNTAGVGTNPLQYPGGVVVDQYIYFSPVQSTKEALRFDLSYQTDGQGSLRQFIDNSNSISGIQSSQFVIAADDNNHFYYADDGTAGQVSLANISTTTQTLDSGIAGIDPDYVSSWYQIRPTTALTNITDTIILDGYTQAGSSTNTLATGNDAVLKIEIDGSLQPVGSDVLNLFANNNLVSGLIVNYSRDDGIQLDIDSAGNSISGNFIGVDASGTIAKANGDDGIDINGVGNTIGGTAPAARNLISGNSFNGINANGAAAIGNTIQGNYIGVDRTGTVQLANGAYGIEIGGATNTIGGAVAGAGNVISGNGFSGIHIIGGGATGNYVAGNFIGTDATGTLDLGNIVDGILIAGGADGTIVGGLSAAERNIISGNNDDGIEVNNADGTVIQGNYIGTDVTGVVAIGNADHGAILFNGAGNSFIGGAAAGAGNVISGNVSNGIVINGNGGSTTDNNVVAGNYVGTDATGTASLGNGSQGIRIYGGADTNTIGGTSAATRNIISGNGSFGVLVEGAGTVLNVVEGNYIGTDVTGTAALGNLDDGVIIRGGAQNNVIGGTAVGSGNLISGNIGVGVGISGAGSVNNLVLGNLIGTDVTGTLALANTEVGVALAGGASNNIIGSATAGNVISGNTLDGVTIWDAGTDANTIQGNLIGTDITGTLALGNVRIGVYLAEGASNNIIGGSGAGEGNVISSNGMFGIALFDNGVANVVGTTIQGNFIGTDVSGTLNLGNADYGIGLFAGALSTVIGGITPGVGNVITNNTNGGIKTESTATDNSILQNSIYDNAGLAIDLGDDGLTSNDAEDVDAGTNDLLNFPILTHVAQNGPNVDIRFDLDLPVGNYRIELYDNPGGSGEAEIYLDTIFTVVTGAGGYETFLTSLTGVIISDATNVTAIVTSTDPTYLILGNTSEVSPAFIGTGVVIVDTTSDVTDGDTSSIEALLGNRGADGFISLREAIAATNNTANIAGNPDEIHFEITAPLIGGAHTIAVGAGGLPDITDAVIIDGTTDADFAGTPIILLDGTSAGVNENGLQLNAGSDGSTVRGLVINSFTNDGIYINSSDGNTIVGNYIGTDVTGTIDRGNGRLGILIDNGSSGNTIGGLTATDRNIISGNDQTGIHLEDIGTSGNVITGNYIGVDVTGAVALGNTQDGVKVFIGADNTTIGGTLAGAGNVIGGNGQFGIFLQGLGVDNNTIQGNFIGTDTSGTINLGNSTGIFIDSSSGGNLIGGTVAGSGNIIANNLSDGVFMSASSGTSNTVIGNSIYSNSGLGIDLQGGTEDGFGVTANDFNDLDSGANNLKNFPVLETVVSSGGNTVITGSFHSTASTTYRIEYFSSIGADASGHGEGQTFLGFTTVTTDASGNAIFTENLIGVTVATGSVVSATSTVDLGGGNYGSTSEFSANLLSNNTAQLISHNDTYLDKDSTADNYGASTSLVLDQSGGGIGSDRILLQFDISQIPAGAVITGAVLQLESTQNGGALDINIYEVLQSWVEGSGDGTPDSANWTESSVGTGWGSNGGDFDPTIIATLNTGATGQHTWDVLTLVQDWYDGSKTNNGLIIGSPNNASTTVTYDSSEGATPPQLLLTYAVTGNVAPTAVVDNVVVGEGASANFDLAGNDSDPDDGLDLASINIISGPSNGTITAINADGTVDYTHDGSETLSDSFTYTIDDNSSVASNIQTVNITVTADNDAPTFSEVNGIVTTDIGAGDDIGYDTIIQPDGKIVVAGYSHNGTDYDFTVTRYNTDGSLDLTFGGGAGIVTTAIGGGDDSATTLLLQSDGKILVGGISHNGVNYDFALVRYNSDGSLDTGFGGGSGFVTTALRTGGDHIFGIGLQSDGSIVAGGYANGSSYDFALTRYTSAGVLDITFGSGTGMVFTDVLAGPDHGFDLAIQSDDRIVLAGISHNGVDYDSALLRYNADGSIDTGFGGGTGIVTTAIGADDRGRSVAIQTDGKILVGGDSDGDFAVIRYNSDGSLDVGFGGGSGIVTTAIGAGIENGNSITIQSDGKILLAGNSDNGTDDDFAVVRYNSDGSLDTSFSTDGILTSTIGSGDDIARGIAVSSTGEIVVIGQSHNGTDEDFALIRYNSDGSRDTSFGSTLANTLDGTPTFIEDGAPVVLDADVKVFDAELSAIDNFNGATLTLVRLAGQNGDDVYSETGTLAALTEGGNLTVTGTTVGIVTTNSNGTLVLTFNASATNALVNSVVQQLAYENTNDVPPASVQIDWTFDDGNSGSQGTGGALQALGNTVVSITPTNDVPVGTGNTVVATEDLPLVIGAGDFNFSDGEGDALQSVTISGLNLNSGTLTHTAGTVTVINGMTVTLAQLADLTFTSAFNDSTNSSFLYTVNDSGAGVATGVMSITVNAVNDVPVATGNTVVASEDLPLVIGAGDFSFSDVEGDALQSVVISGLNLNGGTLTHTGGTITVTNGMTVSLAQLTDLTFTSALNDSTNSSFTYLVSDAGSGITSAVMTITVNAVNDVPVATGNALVTNEDQPLIIGAGDFNFSDIEGDALQSVTITGLNLNGGTLTHTTGTVTVINGMTVTLAQLADLTFTPALNDSTNSSFIYTANDAGAGVSSGVMNITVNAINDVPVATGNTVVTNEDQPLLIGAGDFSFTDVEGDGLVSVTISGLALNGGTLAHTGGTVPVTNGTTVTLAQLADLTFSPALNSTTNSSFTYTVNDAGSGVVSAVMNITVNAVNDVPVATGNTVVTNEDQPLIIGPGDFNFTDTEGNGLVSVTISGLNLNGGTLTHTGGTVNVVNGMTVTSAQLADLTFTSALNNNNDPSFTYTVNDSGLGIVSATMDITVNPVNDAPVNLIDASTLFFSAATGAIPIDPVLTITDVDSATLTSATIWVATGHIAAEDRIRFTDQLGITGSFNATTGIMTLTGTASVADYQTALRSVGYEDVIFTPTQGTLTVNFTVSDGSLSSIVDTRVITVVPNAPPNAVDDAAVVNEGSSVIINVAGNDSDSEGVLDLDSIVIVSPAANGSLVVNGDGTVTYSHDGSETLSDTFTYTIEDQPNFLSNVATVTITVNPVNDNTITPVVDVDVGANAVDENAVVGTTVGITAFADDIDSTDSVAYTLDDNDGGRFAIDANSGVVTVAGAIDRETDGASRNIIVRATSSDSTFSTSGFAIAINDLDEFDVGTVSDVDGIVNAVNENAIVGTVVGLTANAVDGDATNSTVTYTLTNNDGGRFAIDLNSGIVTVVGAIDREADGPSRNITVRAASADGSFSDQLFAIVINDVDEFDVGVVSDVDGSLNAVDENSVIGTVVGVTANGVDADATNSTVTCTLTNNDGGRFGIDINTGLVTVAGAIDREADGPTRNITVRATSTDGSFTDQIFAIGINDVDEFNVGVVSDVNATLNAVDENVTLGTIVGITANASDVDATNNTVTYTLANNDGGRFAIDLNSGVVTVAGAIDREADGPSRNITVRATSTDGSFSDQLFSITINDLDEFDVGPVSDADVAVDAVDENSAIGTVVGLTASGIDGDATNSTVTYTLTNNDGGRFTIDLNSGVVTVAGAIDREADGPSRNITVRATSTDGSFSDQVFAIAINDVDEFNVTPVVDLDGALESVDENSAIGTAVGITASAFDADATTNTITYTLTNNDGGRFAIDINSGIVTVAGAIDREADGPSRNITVRASSSDGSFSDLIFAITINDLDEFDVGPVSDADVIADAVDENSAIGTVVGITANAIDGDATNSTISYVLTNNDGGRFAIDINSGVVTVAGAIDREADGLSRNVTVRASSTDGSFTDQIFAIAINDLDEFNVSPVVDVDGAFDAVDENSAIGTVIGITANAVDADATTNAITYTLTNNDGGRFAVDINSGVVTVAGAIDREADGPSRNISVRATSADGSFSDQIFAIAINDLDEFDVGAVSDTDATLDAVDENSAIGTVVGITANAVDGDATNSAITYTLTNNDGGRFAVDINSGVVTVAGAIDREADGPVRNITVRASSADGSFTDQVFAIAINDLDEFDVSPVVDVDGVVDALDENSAIGTAVGITANAFDGDATNNTITYTLTNNDGGRFAIDINSGVVTLAGTVDREADGASRNITVRASSSDGSFSDQIFTIAINDLDEFDVGVVSDVDATLDAVDENSAIGTVVGITANAVDADATNSTISYTLTNNDGGRFAVDVNNGVVTVAGAIDREADGPSRNITVRATSLDGSFTDQVFAISINDVDEFDVSPVVDVDATVTAIDENSAVGTLVGLTASAFDGDATNNTITYSLADNDGGRFAIDINSGVVTLAGAVDREADGASRNITVRASSSDGSFTDQVFGITINDLDEFDVGPISDVDVLSDQVDENSIVGAVVGLTANAVDGDATNSTISYTLIDDDGGRFAIDINTGVVSVGGPIDYEVDGSSRNIIVRATSSDGSFSDQGYSITINDVNDTSIISPPGGGGGGGGAGPTDPIIPPTVDPDLPLNPDEPDDPNEPEIVVDPDSDPVDPIGGDLPFPSRPNAGPSAFDPVPKGQGALGVPVIDKSDILRSGPLNLTHAGLGLVSLNSDAFWSAIDEARSGITGDNDDWQSTFEKLTVGGSVALTAGYVSWLLRGGVLVTAMMSSLSVWQTYDPLLVVLGRKREDKDKGLTKADRLFDEADEDDLILSRKIA